MWRSVSGSMVCLLLAAGLAAAGGRGVTVITGKFESYKDGVLKVKDLRANADREFKLDADTSIVSVSNTKQKLPQATAFTGVDPGRILRVYVQGKGDDAKVVAVQIAVGGSGGRPRPGAEDLNNVEPKFVVTAEDLLKENKADRKATEAKYLNQVVEISGVVTFVGKTSDKRPYVGLGIPTQFVDVMCFTVDKEPWAKVAPGQKVKMKGRWPPAAFRPMLASCVFLDMGPNPAIKIAAPELVKEFLADKDAAARKYDNRWLIIEGVVADRRWNDKQGFWAVELKGNGKVNVSCGFGPAPDAVKGISTGKTSAWPVSYRKQK